MFDKKYFFLSGVPRSGNTLLGSILNQNENISVTGNSIVSEMLYRVDQCKLQSRSNNFLNLKSHDDVCNNILKNYYQSWKSKYIIDRSAWGAPDNLEILKKYCPNDIKIIVLLRDIEEVLASFIKWSKENPNNFIDQYKTVDEQCNMLMNENGLIIHSLMSAHNLLKDENRQYALFLTYNQLTDNPQETINKIYKFLNIRFYNHDFKKIEKFSANGIVYNDDILGKNLHKIREGHIHKKNYDPKEYVPQETLNKYLKYNFWKNLI